LDVFLRSFHVLIDRFKTFVNIPKLEQTERGGSSHLTSVLVAEDPVISALLFTDKKVIAKTCVDKSIHISLSQVLLGTVELCLSNLSLFKMGLKDSLWMLWFHLIKVTSQLLVVLAKLLLSNDLV